MENNELNLFGPNVKYILALTWPVFIDRHCVRTVEDGGFYVRVRKREFSEQKALFPLVGECLKAHLLNLSSAFPYGQGRSFHFRMECLNSV